MAISSGLQATCDAKIDDLVTQLSTLQTTYKTTNGKYWQGLACPMTMPADGATVASTPTVLPSDQARVQINSVWYGGDWNHVGVTLDANLPVCLEVHAYNGPQGHGYVVCGKVVEAGATYCREVNVGPETYRQHGWVDVTPA
jgi:hypothetical protein